MIETDAQRPLTLPQVAEAAEVEYATLHSWIKRGLLIPSLQASRGTGSPNLFSADDLLTAKVLADLRRNGVDFGSLLKAAKKLRQKHGRLTGEEVLVVNGRVDLLSSEASLGDALGRREPTTIYPIVLASETVRRYLSDLSVD